MEYKEIGMGLSYRVNANYMHTRTPGWVLTVEYSGMHALWEDTRGDDFIQCKKSIKATLILMKYMLEIRSTITEVKQHWVWLVLGWVTTCEHHALLLKALGD
jgi:hypothetical protein